MSSSATKNRNYLPNNKSDIGAVDELKKIPFETIRKDVPKLLEWMQYGHWDVAHGIAAYLIPHVIANRFLCRA